MKIAFFSGPIEYSVCLANALSQVCEIDFFYSERYAKLRDDSILGLLDGKIRKIPITPYRIRDPRNIRKYMAVANRLKAYDSIHIQTADIWLSLFRFLYKKVPMIFTVHDPEQHSGLNPWNFIYQDLAQKIAIEHASEYFVHGERLKTLLATKYRLDEEQIHVIPHGEFSFYKRFPSGKNPLPIPGSRKMILFFGSIRKNKGLEYLIQAEPLISKDYNDYRIVVAGKFPGNLAEYQKRMVNPDKFIILDEYIPNSRVSDLFESASMVVLPYTTATQSGVLPLAFGYGKPVIATDTGSIREALDDGRTGFVVPPCDAHALAQAALKLLTDEETLKQFGENALMDAKTRLSWDTIAGKTLGVHEKHLTETSRKRSILMIGTDLGTKGGVSAVVSHYLASPLNDRCRIDYLPSHREGGMAVKITAALKSYGLFFYRLIVSRPDIVHIHAASRGSFYRKSFFVILSKWFGKKVIYHHHGGEFMIFFHNESGWLTRKWIGWILKKPDLILTLSENWKENLLTINPALPVQVLPNPVSMPACSCEQNKEPVTILFMGRLVSQKGIMDLIDAAAILSSHALSFTMVFHGEGETERFKERCREKKVEDRVMFKGWVHGKEKEAAYLNSQIFVLPSYNEGLPMGILEALSYGMPVVATRVGGIPDAVKDGVNGFLTLPGDVTALAEALARLIGSPELRIQMGSAGRALAASQFEVSIVTDHLEKIYQWLFRPMEI